MNIDVILAILLCFGAGYYLGYEKGAKETEERWSNAVAKANYQRDLARR